MTPIERAPALATQQSAPAARTGRTWKRRTLCAAIVALLAIAVLWAASFRWTLRQDLSAAGYIGSIVAARGQLNIEIFRDVPEDEFYWHAELRIPKLALLNLACIALLCLPIHRDLRKWTAAGFPIQADELQRNAARKS